MGKVTGTEDLGGFFQGPAIRANVIWLAAALSYGYALFYLLLQKPYSDGPFLATVSVAAFALLLLGSVRRIRKHEYYEICAAVLMIGYSLDSLYHSEEVLLSLFLLLAVSLIVLEEFEFW